MKVSDTQFNQSQQVDPVDDIDDARMTVLSPGMDMATTNLMQWNSSK